MDVVLNGQSRAIEHVWTCTHEKGVSAVSGWMLYWQAPNRTYVVKAVADDLVVFFRQPPSDYCLTEGRVPYLTDIGVIPDPSTLDNVIVHHVKQFPRSRVLLGGTIELLSFNPRVRRPSLDEIDLELRLLNVQRALVTSFVTITPESVWSRYPKLNSYFAEMNTMTVAPPPASPNDPLGFAIWRRAPLTEDDVHKRLYYSVEDLDGIIRFDPAKPPEQWQVFRLDSRDFRRSSTFCYAERCVSLKGSSNEIYDPATRNIVGIGHSLPLENWFH
jgi:hypothetical protein